MVQVINRITEPLPNFVEKILAHMFVNYYQVLVQQEFTSGLSGSRVFLVRPIRTPNSPELPAIVKIDRVARIQQEWNAYGTAIQDKLPGVAEIRGQPAFPPGNPWGGLRYPLAGSGTFDVESLHQYYNHASREDVLWVLERRLFRSLETLWRQSTTKPGLHIQTTYDSFLPGNLLIECQHPPPGSNPRWFSPDTVFKHTWASKEYVQLTGFRVVKITPEKEQLSLDMPEDSPFAFRFHVQAVSNITEYEVGQVIQDPLTGYIRQTRAEQLAEQVRGIFGSKVDVTAETLTLPTRLTLPNPLRTLPGVLNQSFDAKVACIHGDLNLENILIDPEAKTAQLIDFAKSGQDHVLKDLIQLETAVLTKLLPEALAEMMAAPEQVCTLYERLHCVTQHSNKIAPPPGLEKPFAVLSAIRWIAQDYLFKREDWTEYYAGLTVYLLGSLKFADLDKLPTAPAPKQVAFLAAAMVQRLLAERPDCESRLSGRPSQSGQVAGTDRPKPEPRSTPEEVNRPVVYNHEVRLQLREVLTDNFSETELSNLCFDLGLDYENLPGRAKPDKARELITYCERHNMTTELVKACRRSRANLPF